MDRSRAWDCTIPERWTAPAREISRFPSDGSLQRVGFPDSLAMDYSRTWDFAIPERWTGLCCRNFQFPSDGLFPRSENYYSCAMDLLTIFYRPFLCIEILFRLNRFKK